MASTTTTSIESTINNTMGFTMIQDKFKSYNNWNLANNINGNILYKRNTNECDIFEILVEQNKIFVSIPIRKSNFQYKTHFNSYYEASEYIGTHLENYEMELNSHID
jgi:hypothetical protein